MAHTTTRVSTGESGVGAVASKLHSRLLLWCSAYDLIGTKGGDEYLAEMKRFVSRCLDDKELDAVIEPHARAARAKAGVSAAASSAAAEASCACSAASSYLRHPLLALERVGGAANTAPVGVPCAARACSAVYVWAVAFTSASAFGT